MENPIRTKNMTAEVGLSDIVDICKLSEYINARAGACGDVVYTGGGIAEARKDCAELKRLKSMVDDRTKHDADSSEKLRELSQTLGRTLGLIREFLDSEEEEAKKARRRDAELYFRSESAPLGEFANDVWNSRAFCARKWDNPSFPFKICRNEIKRKINETARGLSYIRYSGGKFAAALIDRYISTLTLDGLDAYKERLESMDVAASPEDKLIGEYNEDNVRGSMSVELCGTADQFDRAFRQLSAAGIEYKVVEDRMPRDAREIILPDFDSFVAFDIETSGSLGIAAGDLPSEIIEIGAVKVTDGVICDRFSTLCNPGRTISPIVRELTGITDEMIAGKPCVGDAIKSFAEFAGDFIIMGHGIKNSDFPYLYRAAKRVGIALRNSYFDTYRYAERVRPEYNFESLKLEALAAHLGVKPRQAHRALGDAETAADVYLAFSQQFLSEKKEAGYSTS